MASQRIDPQGKASGQLALETTIAAPKSWAEELTTANSSQRLLLPGLRAARCWRPPADHLQFIYSSLNVSPALATRRAMSASPSAAPGVVMPPSPSGTSRTRHNAVSAIIFEVEP